MSMLGVSAALLVAFGCGGSGPAAEGTTTPMRVVVEGSGSGSGATVTGASSGWLSGSVAQTRVLVGADGQTYVGVWIETPDEVTVTERAPMALSLVVDTSGSMEGQKIEYARMAASSMIESLRDGDIVSIYAFENGVTEISPTTVVGPGTRSALIQRTAMLQAMGGTNMYGGIMAGQAQLAQTPPSHPIRRLVVISDGRANVGPSDPVSLGVLAAQGTEHGVSISAIGVGLDYDERTLASLAVQSAGRLYHLEQPEQMAIILRQELDLLQQTVATNAFIEIVPAQGVQLLGVDSIGGRIENGRLRVPVGALHAGQEREVLFRAQIDTSRPGSASVGTARLVFDDPSSREQRTQSVPLDYEITTDAGLAERSSAPRVVAMVANQRATEAQLQASQLLNQGRAEEAARQLDFAAQVVTEAAAAAPAAPSSGQLMQRAGGLRSGAVGARRATTPTETRARALEAADAAMDAEGY
jgi:Ca-activated chloride channel family protein